LRAAGENGEQDGLLIRAIERAEKAAIGRVRLRRRRAALRPTFARGRGDPAHHGPMRGDGLPADAQGEALQDEQKREYPNQTPQIPSSRQTRTFPLTKVA
jgi:hypothetical protein